MRDQTVVEVSRDLAADPVSTALLLTSADALEWWPGLRRAHGGGDGSGFPATLPAGRAREHVDIEALPPRRTATAFVARFQVRGGTFGTTTGAVSLTRRADGTRATMTLTGPRADLAAPARRFLTRLAKVAEARATAA